MSEYNWREWTQLSDLTYKRVKEAGVRNFDELQDHNLPDSRSVSTRVRQFLSLSEGKFTQDRTSCRSCLARLDWHRQPPRLIPSSPPWWKKLKAFRNVNRELKPGGNELKRIVFIPKYPESFPVCNLLFLFNFFMLSWVIFGNVWKYLTLTGTIWALPVLGKIAIYFS